MTLGTPDSTVVPVEVPGRQRRLVVVGGLWSSASQLLPAGGTAVLSVVAARVLGSDALGRQSVIAYVNMAIAAVVVSALGNAALQRMGVLRGAGDEQRAVALAAWARRATLLGGVFVGAVVTGVGLLLGQDQLAWAIIGVVALADAAADGIATRMLLEEGYTPVSRLRLVFQLVGPPVGIVGVAIGLGVPGIFLGDGLAALGLWAALGRRQRRRREAGLPAGGGEPLRLRPPVRLGRRYRLFVLNEVVAQVVARRVEFLVLASLSTSREVAMYSVAFITVSLVGLVPSGIAGAALPLVAAAEGAGRIAEATGHLRFAVRLGTLVSLPLAALVAALGPSLVQLVYGRQYDRAAHLVPLAAVALLVPVAVSVCSQWWSGRGQLGVVLVSGGVAAVVDLAVAGALARPLGALGAVIANLAGQLTLAVGLLGVTVRRTGPLGWRLRGLLGTTLMSAAAGAAALATVDALHDQLSGSFVARALALTLAAVQGLVIVIVGVCVVGVLEPEEAAWLAPVLPRRVHRALALATRRPAAQRPVTRR